MLYLAEVGPQRLPRIYLYKKVISLFGIPDEYKVSCPQHLVEQSFDGIGDISWGKLHICHNFFTGS